MDQAKATPEPQIEDEWGALPPEARSILVCGLAIGFALGMLVVWASYAGQADAVTFRAEQRTQDAQSAAVICVERLLEVRKQRR